jgi:hypothetical protein
MISSLLYITASHPDIMHVVGMVGRYQSAPKQSHLLAVKRIFRYLKETMTYGLWYPRNQNFQLTAYSNANWANLLACLTGRVFLSLMARSEYASMEK